MRGMLRNLGAKTAPLSRGSAGPPGAPHLAEKDRLAVLDAFEEADIAWFWATDSDNRLIYLSESALRKRGPNRNIIGQPLTSLIEPVPESDDEAPERPLSFLLGARNRFAEMTV